MDIRLMAALSGLCFGIWPLLMNRSGLNSFTGAGIFTAIVFICVLPFALTKGSFPKETYWYLAVLAGIIGAIGILLFNGMLAKATVNTVGTSFVIMILVQTTVPAIHDVVFKGEISPTKIVGFLLAIVAAILLTKS